MKTAFFSCLMAIAALALLAVTPSSAATSPPGYDMILGVASAPVLDFSVTTDEAMTAAVLVASISSDPPTALAAMRSLLREHLTSDADGMSDRPRYHLRC